MANSVNELFNALYHCLQRSLALGETAEAYNFCSTGPKQLDEFGIGIGLYFRQLYYLVIIIAKAYLLHPPLIL